MSLSRSVTPPEASQSGSSIAGDSPQLVPGGTNGYSAESGPVDERVLFEGYLYKVPPLKKSLLMVKWSKRWFVLKKVIQADVVTISLCYFKDINKKSEPRKIDLSKITGIRPSSKIGSSDHIFAIETEERKYILKARDHNTKNIWLAKLCELCGKEVVYHVTIPKQEPIINVYNEAIIRFGEPGHVIFATPSSNSSIFSIPHSDVRRLGLNNSFGYSMLWFEACHDSISDEFFFVLVPSGYEMARQILQELKVAIQSKANPLIKEESGNIDISYIARSHYGCKEFSAESRHCILQHSLYHIPSSQSPQGSPLPAFSGRFFPPILPQGIMMDRKKDLLPSLSQGEITLPSSGSGGVSLEEFGRRKTYSRFPPSAMSRKPTLDKFRHGSTSSFDRQMSISSMDHSTRTSSIDRTSPQSSVTETETEDDEVDRREGHFSSSSGSDVFDSTIVTSGISLKRKLSQQSSLSSQNSAPYSSSSHSPPIMEEVIADSFTFENAPPINTPVVPPRSVISLSEVMPAH